MEDFKSTVTIPLSEYEHMKNRISELEKEKDETKCFSQQDIRHMENSKREIEELRDKIKRLELERWKVSRMNRSDFKYWSRGVRVPYSYLIDCGRMESPVRQLNFYENMYGKLF